MDKDIFEKYESEVRSYCRKFPTVFSKAKGALLFNEDGDAYIDFFCGAGAVNYGHNNDYIKDRLIDYLQQDGIIHALDIYTTPKRSFIEYFQTQILQPRGLNYKLMFPGPTGTNAVEAAMKLARKVKQRSNIFALMGAFHGMTLGALAATTEAGARHGAGVPLIGITHVPAPYMFPELDTIAYMERLLTDDHSGIDRPAALIIETTQAEGGVYIMSNEWLQQARALCDKYDMLLIIDDIQVGSARTGWFFSFERAGIVPDIFCLSKSISGYGLPMSITLFKPELDIWSPGEHNGTFRGVQLAFVAAQAGLEYMLKENVESQARDKGKIVLDYLKKEILPLDTRLAARGIGLINGIDFSALPDKTFCHRVIDACFRQGLIIEAAGRNDAVLKIFPPLIIDEQLLLQGLLIIKNSIASCLSDMNEKNA